MWLIILIIFLVVLNSKNKEIESLHSEILQLKMKIKSLENAENRNTTNTVVDALNKETTVAQVRQNVARPEVTRQVAEEIRRPVIKKETLNPEEKRNTSILVTGSVLIVLSAIVFLTTAWNAIPNIIKTFTLFLFVGIFLGASKIAKEKFRLDKASKTFFYIAMAYLPICLLSISIFGLFGDFLSVWGEGKYIYLGVSSAILAAVYYAISKNTEEDYLVYGSALSQILAVILFSLLFEENIFICCVNILIYNLLLIFFTQNTIFRNIANYIPALIAVIALAGIGQGTLYTILTFMLLAINFLILEFDSTHILKATAFNFYLLVFGFSLIFKESFALTNNVKQILMLLYMIPVFGIEHLVFLQAKNSKDILSSSRVLSVIVLSGIYWFSVFESALLIPSFIVGLILMAVLILSLKFSNMLGYKYLAYSLINVLLLDLSYNLFKDLNLEYLVPLITSGIIIGIEKLYPSENDHVFPVYLCILESIALICTCLEKSDASTIIAIAYVVGLMFYNKKSKLENAYNVPLLALLIPNICFANLSKELEIGIMILSSIALTFLSIQEGQLNVYTLFSIIYLFFGMSNFENEYLSEILFIMWSAIHLYCFQTQKEQDIFKACTIFGITAIYYSVGNDIGILESTLFKFLGVTVAGIITIKGILSHYAQNENTDTIEYLFWTIIYLGAIVSYSGSGDGIAFSFLILAMIFIGYYKKYGATFLSGILAILANAFLLTRTFWLMIPWWIYLLGVGSTLIAFAIKNEANENKISVKKVLKNIKDSCEK